jgi:hypothetical protein
MERIIPVLFQGLLHPVSHGRQYIYVNGCDFKFRHRVSIVEVIGLERRRQRVARDGAPVINRLRQGPSSVVVDPAKQVGKS